ncbi:carbohydrate binding domain-containing protein [uncultured Bacteroides sp.]|uniref:carbohydrate binding domain-containing protein n=1 Tax=uncultured Bacteroides sp. TaxID=162156 RepID=UPI002AABF850|nr:carbohydrate binding domain-containing protein [uncultured Bacteroides sp.]
MTDTIDILKKLALQVRNAVDPAENTAERVGRLLVGILENLSDADIEELAKTFLRKDQPDKASEAITFLKGLLIGNNTASIDEYGDAEVRNLVTRIKATVAELEAKTVKVSDETTTLNLLVQALAKTYDLNVSNVATLFRTIIKDYVSSETFIAGLAGEGFKLYKALSGDWNLEVDNVTIRKGMTVFELIISKIRSVNGGLVVSQGNGRIKSVTETTGTPAYYVLGIEGDMTFAADDFVRCQVFSSTGAKYYWVRVDSVNGNSIVVLKSEFPEGTVPAVGDDLVQMGNKTNTARQGVLYLSAAEDGKPRFSVLDGVNSTDLTGKNKVILGCLDGITDSDFPSDAQPSGYGLWAANVFLKGLFILRNGKSIEDELNDQITAVQTAFEIREGQISSKVTQATAAAQTATNKAGEAAASAGTASSKASAAADSENTAGQKATAASNSAAAASGSAKAAKDSADNASEILSQVTTKQSSIDQTADHIATQVKEVNTKASAAADSASAAASSASNAANSASQASGVLVTVTQKETNINQTASDINLKATRAESAAGRAESAEANINVKADGVVVQAASSAAQKAIDGVIVGGTNLFRYSKPINDNNQISNVYANGGSDLSIDYTNTYLGRPTLKITGQYGCYWAFNPTIEPGVIYTISAMVKGSIQVNATGYTPLHIQIPVGGHSYEHLIAYDDTITTEWKQVYRTFSSTAPANTNLRLYIYSIGTSVVNVAWVKLEKGNKATDWSEAQEDITADYTAKLKVLSDQISSKVSQQVFDSLSGTVNTHSTAITQLPTTIDARITSQTQDGGTIKSKVESWFSMVGNTLSMGAKSVNITGATVFSSLATNESVTTAVNNIEVGGTNYYSNKTTPVSPLYGSPHIEKDVGVCPNGLYLIGTAADSAIRISEVIKSNGWYTISFDIRGSQGQSSGFNVDICDNYVGMVKVSPDNNWVHHKLTGYVGNYSPTVYNFIDFEHLPYIYIFIRNIKVEKGNKATDFSLAAEDVNASISISQTAAITTARDNLALRLGYANYADMEANAIAGKSIINGGRIRTSLINADAVITGSLLASKIAATDITTGRLTVTTGAMVGGFKVSGYALTNEGFNNNAYIVMANSTIGTHVAFGANVADMVGSFCTTARIENKRTDSPFGDVVALKVSASGSADNYVYSDVALDIGHGCISGLRLRNHTIVSNRTLLSSDNIIFTERDGSDIILTLPSNPERGQIYFIRKNGTGRVYIRGSYIINDGDWVRERSTEVQLNRGGLGILMYNGTYWTWNNMNG